MKKVFVLQHIHCETLGTLEAVLKNRGIAFEYVRSYEGAAVPENLETADGLIVMGGPMGVGDQAKYPYLKREMALIETALKEKKPLLGVCLGSQLLASALGARVFKGDRKEIGWYPVTLSAAAARDPLWNGAPGTFMACHWHGDQFELPQNAVSLASSALTPCQAFRFGPAAYGILFHLELTLPMLTTWVREFAGELREEKLHADRILQDGRRYLSGAGQTGQSVFGRWAGLLGAEAATP